MSGELFNDSGFWRVVGKWALSWDPKEKKSKFEWRSSVYSPDELVSAVAARCAPLPLPPLPPLPPRPAAAPATVRRSCLPLPGPARPQCPPSGDYEGFFDLNDKAMGRRKFQEQNMVLTFSKNTAGGLNLEGQSETEFGRCKIVGVVDTSLMVRAVKVSMLPAGAAPATAPATPAAAPAVAEKKPPSPFAKCKNILKQLKSKDKAGWFLYPVDPVALGLVDYAKIITRPMDFSTIEGRLNGDSYRAVGDFADDVRLTLNNAMTYNPPLTPVHQSAKELLKYFERRFAALEGRKVQRAPAAAAVPKRQTPGKVPPSDRKASVPTPNPVKVRVVEPPAPSWRADAMQLIRHAAKADAKGWFKEPLPLDYTDYHEAIKTPMDLRTLKEKLQGGSYASMDLFLEDARLIFTNALTFNREGEPCYVAAENVWTQFETKLANSTGLPMCDQVKAIIEKRRAQRDAGQGRRGGRPGVKVGVTVVLPLTIEEKEKLSEDINELDDDQMDKAMAIIEKAVNLDGNNDVELELDIDQLPTKTQRELQKFGEQCLNPGSAAAEAQAAAAAAAAPKAEGAPPAPRHPGKALNAPPVKVSSEAAQPDSAKTDSENSPSQTPEVEGHERTSNVPATSSAGGALRGSGLPPKPPQRRSNGLAGDVTSSSEDDSDAEGASAGCATNGKRPREEGAGAPSAAGALDAENRMIEAAAPTPGDPVPDGALERGQSNDAWLASANTMGDAALPDAKRARMDTMDDAERNAWRESQEKSNELKVREARKRQETEFQRQAQMAEQEKQRQLAQAEAQRRAEEAAAEERKRAEQARMQAAAEKERQARLAEQQTRQTVDLDADANLVSEYL